MKSHLVFLIFLSLTSVVFTCFVSAQELEAPKILEIPKNLKSGQNLIIKGSVKYQNGIVRVFVQKNTEEPTWQDVSADDEGRWVFIYDEPIKEGAYKIWTMAIDNSGKQSPVSEKFILTIMPHSFWATIKESNFAIITLLIIISILAFYVFYQKINRKKEKDFLFQKIKEADEIVSKIFWSLREEAKEEILEKRPLKEMMEAFKISEEFIKKEVTGLERKLEDYKKMPFVQRLTSGFKKESNIKKIEEFEENTLKMEDKELPIDIYQTDSEFIIVAPAAGVGANDLKIFIEKDIVTIEGKREMSEIEDINRLILYQEVHWGPFSRQVIMPEPIESLKATAYLKKGALILKIPKQKKSNKNNSIKIED